MKHRFLSLIGLMALAASLPARAEDIDLFNIGYTAAGASNVLIYLDNTANWNASNQQWAKSDVLDKCSSNYEGDAVTTCEEYVSEIFGTATKLTQGQVELRAIKLVLNKLVCNVTDGSDPVNVNIGIMILPPNKGAYTNNSGSSTDPSAIGGVIFKAVTPLLNSDGSVNSTACNDFISSLDFIETKVTDPAYKAASSANYGGGMFEAFKYFGGFSNPALAGTNTAASPTGHVSYGPTPYSVPSENTLTLDVNAFTDSEYESYIAPGQGTCGARNYILLVGNTWPNADDTLLLSGSGHLGYSYSCSIFNPYCGVSQPRIGDVWAQFLANADVSPVAGTESVYTSTINVYNKQPDGNQTTLLKSMAAHGRGSYYEVGGDISALVNASEDFFRNISTKNTAFSSASLPVSVTAQGTYLNQVYIGMFRPDDGPRWPGNLKQYKLGEVGGGIQLLDANGDTAIDPTTGFVVQDARSYWTPTAPTTPAYWTNMVWPAGMTNYSGDQDTPDGNVVEKGGHGYRLRQLDPASRHIYTCNDATCASLIAFTTVPTSSVSADDRDWEIGYNIDSELGKSTSVMRPSVHGDVLHSRPVALDFSIPTDTQPKVIVFYGGNDGLLHAINGNREGGASIGGAAQPGDELWSFVPTEFYGLIPRVRANSPALDWSLSNPTTKPYGIDGSIVAYKDGCIPDPTTTTCTHATTAWVYATMRRGGDAVYAFHYDEAGAPTLPVLEWKIDSGTTGFSDIGQTWSTPKVFQVSGYVPATGTSHNLLIMGGGYDTCEDVDTGTTNNSCSSPHGDHVYILNADTGNLIKSFNTDRSVIADVTVAMDSNGYATYAYAADLGGNVYRIDLTSNDSANWSITKIADLGCSTVASCNPNRKFMFAPDVVLDSGTYYILLGSGDREKPVAGYEATASVVNHFFVIKDQPTNAAWLTSENTNCSADVICMNSLVEIGSSTPDTATLSASKGWYLDLFPTEQVVTSAITVYGNVTFSTHTPTPFDAVTCTTDLGTTRVYNISYLNAASNNGTGNRFQIVSGGGLPPSPVAGQVLLDNGTVVPFVIGASPDSPLQAVKPSGPPGSSVIMPKSRVYWYIQQ